MEWDQEQHGYMGLVIGSVHPGQELRILVVATGVHEVPAPSQEAVSVYYVLQPGLPDKAAPPKWSLTDDTGTVYQHSGHGERYLRGCTLCYEDWWPLPPQEAGGLRFTTSGLGGSVEFKVALPLPRLSPEEYERSVARCL